MRKNNLIRFSKHLVSHRWQVKSYLSDIALHNIEKAIEASESKHGGEISFVVEAGLHPYEIIHQKTPRKRAIEIFSRLHIWDTEENNGVLIYLLLADRDVEIVADRGIDKHIGHVNWTAICSEMEVMFMRGQFEAGVLYGINKIGALLEKHFPLDNKKPKTTTSKKKRNEISNKPVIL
ncbi:MAG: TPM domain-containing protein [Methylophilaceae bacterium]